MLDSGGSGEGFCGGASVLFVLFEVEDGAEGFCGGGGGGEGG